MEEVCVDVNEYIDIIFAKVDCKEERTKKEEPKEIELPSSYDEEEDIYRCFECDKPLQCESSSQLCKDCLYK